MSTGFSMSEEENESGCKGNAISIEYTTNGITLKLVVQSEVEDLENIDKKAHKYLKELINLSYAPKFKPQPAEKSNDYV